MSLEGNTDAREINLWVLRLPHHRSRDGFPQEVNNTLARLTAACCCRPVFQTAAEGDNKFGQANTNYPIQAIYGEGDILEVKIVFSTYHWVSKSTFLDISRRVLS